MATFDFKSYLSSIDPSSTYEIEPLVGGLVNLTVRARKTSNRDTGAFPNHASVIIKYAPAFVATAGPELEFPPERQRVEAAALRLFHPGGPLGHIGNLEQIHVPRLIHHDEDRHILIIQDLGPMVTLLEFLESPEGTSSAAQVQDVCESVGRRVGSFLAKVHYKATRDTILRFYGEDNPLSHTVAHSLIRTATVAPVLKRLLENGLADVDADRLSKRVESDFDRANLEDETRFAVGDFHPGSVLVSPWQGKHATWPHSLAFIDWEFASTDDRGVNGDLPQFLAFLHLHLLSLAGNEGSLRYIAARSFVDSMTGAYASVGSYKVSRVPPTIESHALVLFRSALILYGREMINQAVERKWPSEGPSKEEMVQVGAWYITRARESVEDMAQEENWSLLQGAADEGRLLSVFNTN